MPTASAAPPKNPDAGWLLDLATRIARKLNHYWSFQFLTQPENDTSPIREYGKGLNLSVASHQTEQQAGRASVWCESRLAPAGDKDDRVISAAEDNRLNCH